MTIAFDGLSIAPFLCWVLHIFQKAAPMKVYIFDPLWPDLISSENVDLLKKSGAEILLTTKGASLTECKDLFSDPSPKIIGVNPDYIAWKMPSESFKDIPNLSCIITQSTSYGWIDHAFAARQGTAVVNIRGFSTQAVAEWAIMMMHTIARRVPLLIKNEFPLDFGNDFQIYKGVNLKGKKVGIVGLGAIGAAIAERAKGLGMDVVYWSKSEKSVSYERVDLKTLFETCDVIFPAMADNQDTHKVITDDLIESMKSSAMFVSVVHKYYNHSMILERVESNSLFGYAFEADSGMFDSHKGNVWAAPAYGWCTEDSMRASMDMFVEAIVDAVHGKYPNKVN